MVVDHSLLAQLGYGILSQRRFVRLRPKVFLKNHCYVFLNPFMRTETILVSKLFLSTYYFVVRYILFDACFDVIVLYIINSSFNYLRGPQICQSILLRVTLVK